MSEENEQPAPAAAGDSRTYGAMLAEVERICQEIQSPDLDLDLLVSKVEHGYDLIKAMRTRLSETRKKVEVLRGELAGAT